MQFRCNTSANITMTTSSRFYLWVGVSLTVGSNSGTFAGDSTSRVRSTENYDSQITLPTPTGPPTISSLTPNTGAVGSSIVIAGTNFRSYQISSNDKVQWHHLDSNQLERHKHHRPGASWCGDGLCSCDGRRASQLRCDFYGYTCSRVSPVYLPARAQWAL